MRRILILTLVLICLIGAALTYVYWPSIRHRYAKLTINKAEEKVELQKTKELLNQDKPEEAMAIIQEYADDINDRTEEGREWLDLLIRASEATSNLPQLLLLHEYYPKAFDSHEKASLLVANQYLLLNRSKDYETLRNSWKGREARPEVWFVLDSDKLLLEGKRKEAIEYLNSRTFPGKSDSARLIRLALLYVFEQPKVAWDYLTQAYNKDPENPDIRSYRAKLLETVGKEQLALSEYVAATQVEPKNPYLKDQLADFYIRTKQYPEALKIWTSQLKSAPLDFIWLKSLFWSRVATPVSFDWHSVTPPEGKLKALIEYLLDLKPGTFWDTAAFERIPEGQTYLKNQQVTFWLRLIQDLKDGKEKEAYDLLQYNPFSTVSWNNHLEEGLKKILLYRKTGRFIPETEQNPLAASDTNGQAAATKSSASLFEQIDTIIQNTPPSATKPEVSADLHALLTGPDVFATAFLTAGWDEAGLALHTLSVIPANYPEEVAVEITKAIRQTEGDAKALEFATLQTPSPTLSLMIGELLIATGSPEAALEKLSKLKTEDSDVGLRAAWIVSLIHIEHGQYVEAKAAVNAQPRLKDDILGKETLARIALLEGDAKTADAMYASIEASSPEAQSYLARKAFLDKDWKRARELTEKLLLQYPNNPLLRENLKKIIEEQNKQ